MRILAFDGAQSFLCRVLRALDERGFVVDRAADAREIAYAVRKGIYELLVVVLVSAAAWGVLDSLRDDRDCPPILALSLSEKAEEWERARECGAAEVLSLPVTVEELLVHIPAVARIRPQDSVRVGALSVDPVRRQAFLADKALRLSSREFDLLALLVANLGETASRSWLLEHIWGPLADINPNTLDVHIGRLRAKLAEVEGGPHIQTVWGRGYRMAL